MANPFVHVELHTGDVGKAKAFYSKLFGWKLKDMPMPGGDNYTMIEVGEGTGGGMMKAQPPDRLRAGRRTSASTTLPRPRAKQRSWARRS